MSRLGLEVPCLDSSFGFEKENKMYKNFYVQQARNGLFVFCDASFQKYYEIESAFASIGQAVLSLLKSGAKAVEKAALISVTQFLDNIIEKNNINVCFYSRKILSLHQKHLNLFSLKLT